MRKTILRHAFVFLFVAFALGLVAGFTGGTHHPHARLWLASHITGLLVAVMVAVIGLAWPELNLGRRAGKALYVTTIHGNYFALAVLGIVAPATGVPQPIAAPNLPPVTWMQPVISAALIVVTISSFIMSGLMVYGLRGRRDV